MEIKSLYLQKILRSVYTPLSWAFMILVLLCLPGSTIARLEGPKIPHLDKYVHFLLFAGLVALWNFYLICKNYSTERLYKGYRLVLFSAVIYGVVLEVVQYCFIPDRSFDLADIVADSAGAAAAYAVFYFKLLRINPGN